MFQDVASRWKIPLAGLCRTHAQPVPVSAELDKSPPSTTFLMGVTMGTGELFYTELFQHDHHGDRSEARNQSLNSIKFS